MIKTSQDLYNLITKSKNIDEFVYDLAGKSLQNKLFIDISADRELGKIHKDLNPKGFFAKFVRFFSNIFYRTDKKLLRQFEKTLMKNHPHHLKANHRQYYESNQSFESEVSILKKDIKLASKDPDIAKNPKIKAMLLEAAEFIDKLAASPEIRNRYDDLEKQQDKTMLLYSAIGEYNNILLSMAAEHGKGSKQLMKDSISFNIASQYLSSQLTNEKFGAKDCFYAAAMTTASIWRGLQDKSQEEIKPVIKEYIKNIKPIAIEASKDTNYAAIFSNNMSNESLLTELKKIDNAETKIDQKVMDVVKQIDRKTPKKANIVKRKRPVPSKQNLIERAKSQNNSEGRNP